MGEPQLLYSQIFRRIIKLFRKFKYFPKIILVKTLNFLNFIKICYFEDFFWIPTRSVFLFPIYLYDLFFLFTFYFHRLCTCFPFFPVSPLSLIVNFSSLLMSIFTFLIYLDIILIIIHFNDLIIIFIIKYLFW